MARFATFLVCFPLLASTAAAMPPSHSRAGVEGTASETAQRDAQRSIPLDKLSAEDRAKVASVLSEVSLFRRLPIRTIDCDPFLYVFLVRHPDVVVNIWEEFKISKLGVRQSGENRFQILESTGAVMSGKFVHQSRNTHVLYGEGAYQGPLFLKPVKGRGVIVLKTAYTQEPSGRYSITSRADCFLSIDSLGVELATKTVSPLLGKTADNNFVQTLAFVGSLSRTAEVNNRGVQRLAGQLSHVRPEVRTQFAELIADLPDRQAAAAANKREQREAVEVASQASTRR